jgi:hypothetical protein
MPSTAIVDDDPEPIGDRPTRSIAAVRAVRSRPATTPVDGPAAVSRPTDERAGLGVLIVGLGTLVTYAWLLGRDLSFFSDDWDIIAFHHDGHVLVPFNGHLSLLPITIFRTLFLTVGIGTYTPYRVVGFAGYCVMVVALYAYGRRRVGSVLAALAALSIAWFSAGDINVLFPFLVNFSVPLAAGAGIWLLRDRDSLHGDVLGGALLAVALASSGIGLTVATAVFVELVLRRARADRWLPYLVPFGLWLLWYTQYRTSIASIGSARSVVHYALREVLATFAGFAGGSTVIGAVLLVAYAALLAVGALRWHTLDARALAALAGAGSFVVLTSITRIGIVPAIPPDTGRYLWVNGFFLVAAALQLARGRRLGPEVIAGAFVLVLVGALTLVGNLRSYHAEVQHYERVARTSMTAVESIPDQVDRSRVMPLSFILVRAGDYLDAVHHLGSPLEHIGFDDLGSEQDRIDADQLMVQDLALRADATASMPPACAAAPAREAAVDSGHTVVVQAGAAPATVSVRRLATAFDAPPFATVPAGSTVAIVLPRDHGRYPWHLAVPDGAVLLVCP